MHFNLGAVIRASGTSLCSVLPAYKRCGLNSLQIDLSTNSFSHIQELVDECSECGIKIVAIGCDANPLQPSRRFQGISADELFGLIEQLPQTSPSELTNIVAWSGTLSGALLTSHPGNHTPGALAEVAAWAERLTPELKRKNARLLLVPHRAHVLHDSETTRKFMRRQEGAHVGIAFDPCNLLSPKNFHERESMLARTMKELSSSIKLAYLKDARIADFNITLCGPGQGQMGYSGLLRQLAEHCAQVPWLVDGVESELQLKHACQYIELHARMAGLEQRL